MASLSGVTSAISNAGISYDNDDHKYDYSGIKKISDEASVEIEQINNSRIAQQEAKSNK